MAKYDKEFIRIKRGNRKLVLQVMQFDWSGPHEAEIKWQTAKTLDTSIELAKLDAEIKQLLDDTRFFGHCSQCNEHKVSSLMHCQTHCQSCAQKYLGIVY